jgi:dihydrofolate reductase
MPELVIDFITSLDGYGAAEGWPGWWGLEGPEYLAWLEDEPEADYTILMGANTYRVMSGLATDGEPGTDAFRGPVEGRLFDHLDGAPVVAEHTAGHPGPCRGCA